jgi:hypothetical protein
MINKLFSGVYDLVDEIIQGNVEKVAEVADELGPEYRETYIPSLEDSAARDSEDFALTIYHGTHGVLNKFACYNKTLTALNIKMLEKNAGFLPDEVVKIAATNLKKAADYYEIDFPEKLSPFLSEKLGTNFLNISSINQTAYHEKIAKDRDVKKEYALKKKKKYPIHTKGHCKKASSYFETYYRDLNIPDRVEFAKNLNEKLAEFGMPCNSIIEKYAFLNPEQVNPDLHLHLKSRKSMTHDAEAQSLLDQLQEKIGEWSPIKLATVLHKIDEKAGLHNYYGRNIEDPVGATFGIHKKAEFEIDGKQFDQDSYLSMLNKNLSDQVDVQTANDLRGPEGPDIFRSLPSPVRQSILK